MTHPIFGRRSLALSIALTLAVFSLAALAAPVSAAGTVTSCSNDSAFSTALVGGGLVNFNCGNSTINLSSTKVISANTTIDGGENIELSGTNSIRLFEVNNGVTLTLKNIVLQNGYGSFSNGGTIYNVGQLVLDNVTIRDAGNSNYFGGGIATIGHVNVTNSEFISNEGGSGGAIYATGANAVVTISSSSFTENSVVSSDPASKRGGAIYITNGATLNLSNSVVDNNRGVYGSGIANAGGGLTLTDVTLSRNESVSSGQGGGIHNTGTANLTRVTFDDNFISTGSGGGLWNNGTATLSSVYFHQNGASYGGGIANDHGTLTVTNALFTGNHANVAGGGGIGSSFGPLTITNATFAENFASGDAGGVENGKGTATLKNVTFYKNFASSGGGMWNLFGGVAELTNVTFFKNHGDEASAGGLGNSNDPGTHLYLRNVVIANSTQGMNCFFQKAPDLSSSNLSSDGNCNFGTGRDNVKIKFGPLGTHGGQLVGREQRQLQTLRVLKGSAPIDKGEFISSILTDERGVTRPRGASFDVGALEYVPCTGAPTKPERIAPSQNAMVVTTTAFLDWAGPDCVKKFSVVVRQGNAGGPIVFAKGNLKNTEVTTTELTVNKKYVWQVTACDGALCTVSDWFKFKRKPEN